MVIRQAAESDRPAIEELLAAVEMSGEVEAEAYLVAEQDQSIVGAGRLEWAGGEAYLRAIAVQPGRQGAGIGAALVKRLIAGESQVKVVSRGSAAPFFRRLGFQAADWAVIDPVYQGECEGCSDRDSCQPQPLVWRRPADEPA